MARTLKSRRNVRRRRNQSRRGGGFFNTLKGMFTRKKAQAPTKLYYDMNTPTAAAPAAIPAPVTQRPRFTIKSLFARKNTPAAHAPERTLRPRSTVAGIFGKQSRVVPQPATLAPISIPPIRPSNASPVFGEKRNETAMEGQLKDISFAYQKFKGQRPSIQKIDVSDAEWSELRLALLTAIYSQGDEWSEESICQTLFSQPLDSFDEELRAFERLEYDPDIFPFASANGLGRLIPQILRTRRELERYAFSDGCYPPYLGRTIDQAKSFRSPFCIFLTNTWDKVQGTLEMGREEIADSFIVVNPKFYSTYNHLYPYHKANMVQRDGEPRGHVPSIDIPSDRFLAAPAIVDAFLQKGLTIIAPKLGYLVQKEAPELWNKQYWLPKLDPGKPNYTSQTNQRNTRLYRSRLQPISEVNTDYIRASKPVRDAVRIVILTLQKYAAIRRWCWSKDPTFASQIYEKNYRDKDIAVELLRPDLDEPDQGYWFDKGAFDRELQENQRWVAGNVYFSSYTDVRLKEYLGAPEHLLSIPHIAALAPRLKKEFMQIPLDPLPEEAEARRLVQAGRTARPLPYTEAEETRNIMEGLNRQFRALGVANSVRRQSFAPMKTGRYTYRHARRRRT